jgi:hypothetical protein
MNSFFTNIEVKNGKYIGSVFNSQNNTKVYTSKEYNSQSEALQDINLFLSNSHGGSPVTPESIMTNIATYKKQILSSINPPVKRCCGR